MWPQKAHVPETQPSPEAKGGPQTCACKVGAINQHRFRRPCSRVCEHSTVGGILFLEKVTSSA